VAPPLPELPERLSRAELAAAAGDDPLRPVLGVAEITLQPVGVDLSRANLVVCGPPLSGRSTAVATVARGILDARASDGPRVAAIGSGVSGLADYDWWDIGGFGRAAVGGALDAASLVLEGYDGTSVRLVLCIDAVEDFEQGEHAARIGQLVRSDAVRVVAVVDPATLSRSFGGWVAELKANRSMLLLQPPSAVEIESLAGRRPSLRPEQAFPPGRGVLVDRHRTALVHVAVP
jgi:S-DNA-T family DNA segregation ATPase FtsK/SpoIIIE